MSETWHDWKVWEHLTSAVVLSSLVFTFLAIFFYTYVAQVERDVFESELVNTFDSLSIDPKTARFVLANVPTNKVTDDEATKAWKERNEKIQSDTWWVVGIVFGACILFSMLMTLFFNFSILKLWARSLVYLAFIGMTEFIFLLLVTREYSTVSPVQVKRIIAKKVQEEKQKNQQDVKNKDPLIR